MCYLLPILQVLRRHLIHIFVFDFPEHYGEVLLIVLRGCSENKLMPSILLELLNTIYKMAQCPEIDANADNHKIKEDILYFAANQKLFSYTELYETIALFARHFQNERLQHGLNGLYPIHKDHCKWISIMFETFGHALIVSSVHANPGALSDTRKLRSHPYLLLGTFNSIGRDNKSELMINWCLCVCVCPVGGSDRLDLAERL